MMTLDHPLPHKLHLEDEPAKRPVIEHPLQQFIRHTFGSTFCSIIMAGLNQEPGTPIPPAHITETWDDHEIHWELQVFGSERFPVYDDPLVLAALLKTLVQRKSPSRNMFFDTKEIMREIGWPEGPQLKIGVAKTIERYAGVSYRKQEVNDGSQPENELMGGWYTLVTGYEWESFSINNRVFPWRICNCVSFEDSFIEGLRESRVVLAGIQLGLLNIS